MRPMPKVGASYKLSLRIVNHPVEAGYDAATIGDVFTEVVRDEEVTGSKSPLVERCSSRSPGAYNIIS